MPRVLSVSLGYPSEDDPARLTFTHEQARALARMGASVQVLDLCPRGPVRLDHRDGIPVLRLPLARSFRQNPLRAARDLGRAFPLLHRWVRSDRFELVLLSFLHHKYLPLLPAMAAGGAKLAVTIHGVDAMADGEGLHVRSAKRRLLERVDHAFAVSEATAELARRLLGPETRAKVLVVPNGVDRPKLEKALCTEPSHHRARLGWPVDRPVILSVGHLVRRKGHDLLLGAVARLVAGGRDPLYVVIGRGPELAALTARRAELGLDRHVRFVAEALDEDTIAAAFVACDVFALGSRTLHHPPAMEGFGVVYAEAAYVGRPAVGGASGGVPSVVEHGETGWLVDPDGPSAEAQFAEALARLLDEPVLAQRMGAAARRRALRLFDWDQNAASVLAAAARSAPDVRAR